jgi:hypothetical protein
MSLAALMNRPVTIIHRADADPEDFYGQGRTETLQEVQGELQQMSRTEQAAHGDFSDTLWRLWLPATVRLRTEDAVAVDGLVYEVVGDPWEVRNPREGAVSHVEATLRRAGAWEAPDGQVST